MRTNWTSRLGRASAALAIGALAVFAATGAEAGPWHHWDRGWHHGWYAPAPAYWGPRYWAPRYYAPPAYAYAPPAYGYYPEPVAPSLNLTIPLR